MSAWVRGYWLMIRWQLLSLKAVLPFIAVVQALVGVGTVIGIGYLYPQIDQFSAKFLSTGGATLALITLGLVFVPQSVAQMKMRGTFDYLWPLPIPRLSYVAADFTIWVFVVLPGVLGALVAASAKYGFGLSIGPLAVPAFLLVTLTGVAVGSAFAHLSPSPIFTGVISNVIIFSLFLFSPVNFPNDRLPLVLQRIHEGLPVKYMGDLVRGTTVDGLVSDLQLPFAVVGAWCVVSLGALFVVFTRRR